MATLKPPRGGADFIVLRQRTADRRREIADAVAARQGADWVTQVWAFIADDGGCAVR